MRERERERERERANTSRSCSGWSKEQLLNAWMRDPAETCEKAGVHMPSILSVDNLDDTLCAGGGGEDGEDCGICYLPISKQTLVPCEHKFCQDCWQQ